MNQRRSGNASGGPSGRAEADRSDLADLVPGRVSSPERRPPYFSVAEPGLADWRLAIRVGGERGLKVRSTLFNGQVSPNLRVQGTLKEPLALGDMKI